MAPVSNQVGSAPSEEIRYDLALDVANIAVWDWHIPSGRANFSLRYYTMLGYEPYELPPSFETWSKLLHPEDKELTESTIQAQMDLKRPGFTVEFRMKTKQNGWLWIMGRGNVVERDAQDKPIRMVGVHIDIDNRKRAEFKLQESQAQLNGILEAFNGIIQTIDKDYIIQFTNRAFREFAGRDVAGEYCYKALHDLDEPCPWCVKDQVFNGETVALEVLSPKNNRWYLTINNPIFGPDGAVQKQQTTAIDITERKQMEKRLELALEATSDGLWDWDIKTGKTYFSPRYFSMLGYGPDEYPMSYDTWKMLLHPEDRETAFKATTEHLEGKKKSYEVEFRLKTKSGKWRWILGRGKVVKRDAAGKAERMVGTHVDITENKQANKALEKSEQSYRRLAANLPGIVYRIHVQEMWRMEYFNNALNAITGYRENELECRKTCSIINLILPEDREAVEKALDAATVNDQPFDIEYRLITKNGDLRHLNDRGRPIFNQKGELLYIEGVIFDITAQKQAEEQARQDRERVFQAAKMVSLGTVVSGVAHEINNPISFIMLNAPILNKIWHGLEPVLEACQNESGPFQAGGYDYAELKEEVPQLLDYIMSGAKRVKNIMADLKSYAQEMPADMNQKVDINTVIEKAIVLTNNLITKSTDHFSVNLQTRLPIFSGNIQRVEQVLINLITNACQALSDRSQGLSVQSGYDRDGNRVTVKVRDQGTGIKPEILSHITDPFFTTRRDRGGTGLGLSVSAGIIESHNGTLVFKSQEGRGTTATISIPVQAPADHYEV